MKLEHVAICVRPAYLTAAILDKERCAVSAGIYRSSGMLIMVAIDSTDTAALTLETGFGWKGMSVTFASCISHIEAHLTLIPFRAEE